MRTAFCLLLAFCLSPAFLFAQTLRGTVRDALSGQALPGASVIAWRNNPAKPEGRTLSDAAGQYFFEKLPPGYYQIRVGYTGYDDLIISELLVTAGKELVADALLAERSTPLRNALVTGRNRNAQPLAEIALPRERVLRFPAMFFDPARLAAASPGVAQTNDGINGLSIRGNGPSSVQWRLEGVEIVNPNHLPNAGTFNDFPAAASGGVLMLSAQMLENSALLTGALPAQYGNSLGGVMDMSLREGNNRRYEMTAQASLVGLDLALEGPFVQRGRTTDPSFLVNYRYSTVGLLGALGVKFGDEKINFQDLAFTAVFPGKRGGYFKIFGMGGLNKNIFVHKADTAEAQTDKDFVDVDFRSRTGLFGFSSEVKLAPRTNLKVSSILSAQKNRLNRIDYLANGGFNFMTLTRLFSSNLHVEQRVAPGVGIRVGMQANFFPIEGVFREYYNIQPWADLLWTSPDKRLALQPGFHLNMWPKLEQSAPQARFLATFKPRAKHAFALFAGNTARAQTLLGIPVVAGSDNVFIQKWEVGLRHRWQFAAQWALQTEVFHQQLSNVPASSSDGRWWLLNEQADNIFLPGGAFGRQGKGRNTGAEFSVERLFEGWFVAANLTLFDSRARTNDNSEWQKTRWALDKILNISGGREWRRDNSEGKNRTLGFSARAVWTGGFREMPIDTMASRWAVPGIGTVFNSQNGFSEQLPDYFRLDARFYWKKSLSNRYSSTLALEFQNLTNRQNVAWRYFDHFTDRVETKYQLGLIPNLTWRLEF